MLQPVCRPSSGMSIQKSYQRRYNRNLRGHLFTVSIFYYVNTQSIHSFHCHVQNVTIPCRSQKILPFLLRTWPCHPSPPSILPPSLTSTCHLFLGLPFIHSIAMCRMRRFLAVLRSFFLSSLLCTFACHPSPPIILPSSFTSTCHLFLGLPFIHSIAMCRM